jgi:hypothetical protein
VCLQLGQVCSSGPSNGLSAEVNVRADIDVGDTTGGIDVSGGKVNKASFGVSNLKAHVKFTYTISRGEGGAEPADPPVIRLPIGVGVTYPTPSGIPLYFKLQIAVLLKLGVSSKNAVIRGGADVNAGGSDTITESGGNVSGTESGDSVSATVLGRENGAGSSISAAPSGTVVAAQFPKLGFGLGTNTVNGVGFIDVVESIGQTTGGAFGGMFCSSYDLFVDVGGGFEAQVGPFVASKKWPFIPQKKFQLTEPGCPKV